MNLTIPTLKQSSFTTLLIKFWLENSFVLFCFFTHVFNLNAGSRFYDDIDFGLKGKYEVSFSMTKTNIIHWSMSQIFSHVFSSFQIFPFYW